MIRTYRSWHEDHRWLRPTRSVDAAEAAEANHRVAASRARTMDEAGSLRGSCLDLEQVRGHVTGRGLW